MIQKDNNNKKQSLKKGYLDSIGNILISSSTKEHLTNFYHKDLEIILLKSL